MTIEEYKTEVINITRSMIKNDETLARLEDYILSEEFEKDIKNNYRDKASVNACAYNIYMWV